MLRFTAIFLFLLFGLFASNAVFAHGLHLDCGDGKLTSIEEAQDGEAFSSVSYMVNEGGEGIFGTIMTMRYNHEELPLGMIGNLSGMSHEMRQQAITDNYERLVLGETFFEISKVTAVRFNGRDYVRFDGATAGRDQHALFYVVAYDDFAKIALTRDVGGEHFELLIAALDDALSHCHISSMDEK